MFVTGLVVPFNRDRAIVIHPPHPIFNSTARNF
jgi:hypothetical protein